MWAYRLPGSVEVGGQFVDEPLRQLRLLLLVVCLCTESSVHHSTHSTAQAEQKKVVFTAGLGLVERAHVRKPKAIRSCRQGSGTHLRATR